MTRRNLAIGPIIACHPALAPHPAMASCEFTARSSTRSFARDSAAPAFIGELSRLSEGELGVVHSSWVGRN